MRQTEILRFWLPLFASWLLMTAEGPLISAAVNRLPDEVVMLAAVGIVISLAVLIESPIINILATSTALVRDRESYVLVRSFTFGWMIAVTVISFLLAFTPLFDLMVRDAMAVPDEVARWVRPGLMIMVFWSAIIAWRRFLQGILIRHDKTRLVGWGTAVRMVTAVATAGGLLLWGGWPGAIVGAVTFAVSGLAEGIYATIVARPFVRGLPAVAQGDGESLSMRALFAYHMPLAGTAVLTLMVQPVVSFTLTRLALPTLNLAAWSVLVYIMLVMRAGALALPEVVIALYERDDGPAALRRFSIGLTAANLVAMLLLALTPLADFYLVDLQSATPEIVELSRLGLILFIPMPAAITLTNWLRGVFMGRRTTGAINTAMMIRLTLFIAVLGLALLFEWPGIPAAVWAFNLSVMIELAYLAVKFRQS